MSIKLLLCVIIAASNMTCCVSHKQGNLNSTISCFSNGKLILKMKSKGRVIRDSKPLLKFKDERGFNVEIDRYCVIVNSNEKLYERKN